jgi:hypothetical protein
LPFANESAKVLVTLKSRTMIRSRPLIALVLTLSILLLLWHLQHSRSRYQNVVQVTPDPQAAPDQESAIQYVPGTPKPLGQPYTTTVVVARQQAEDVSWLETSSLDVTRAIYVVDNSSLSPEHPIPMNKGHEAMVYLSYIIDHYDNLSDISIFVHAHQRTWHNNDLLNSDMLTTIEHLNPAHVARVGYFNLRCHHEPGCPDWLHLDRPDSELDTHRKMEERAFSLKVWKELHPQAPPPSAISQPCCAQFAVSKERILAIPRAEFIRYRDWLLHTDLPDVFSGRVMEYSWQFLFAGVAELCPAIHVCYCQGYGICFEGAEELQEYFDIRADMRKLQSQIPDMEGMPGREQRARVEVEAMDAKLEQMKAGAFDRGLDPRSHAVEGGRVWPEGDQ